MSPIAQDPRAVAEYRVPAESLRPGDLVNTSPGGDDDWQQVLTVATAKSPGTDIDLSGLAEQIGDRYVVVQLTDIAPIDSPVYFDSGAAMVYGSEEEPDRPVSEFLSDASASRIFLYTKFELVTVRA